MKKTLPCGRPVPVHPKTSPKDQAADFSYWKRKLDAYLEEARLNQSQSRDEILRSITLFDRHFTIPELVRQIQDRHPEIGPATVYRAVPTFVKAGILQESLSDEDKLSVYELGEDGHHDHIICLKCRAIFEFHDTSIEAAQDKLARRLGFHVASHRHVIYADCLKLKS